MLSSVSCLESSTDFTPSTDGTFFGSMSALLLDDSLEEMDTDRSDVDVSKYLDEYVDSAFSLVESTSSVTASPYSDHTTVSRTSSDEGFSSSVTSSYTLPVTLDQVCATESSAGIFAFGDKSNVSVEDFPYEDVLSLENALKEAVGDSFKGVVPFECDEVLFQREEGLLKEHDSVAVTTVSRVKTGFKAPPSSPTVNISSIPSIGNIFPKVSHRVVTSPTTTRVLSDDVMRKKHRPIATTSNVNSTVSSTKRLDESLTRISISTPAQQSHQVSLPPNKVALTRSRSFSLTVSSMGNSERTSDSRRSETPHLATDFLLSSNDPSGYHEVKYSDGKYTRKDPKTGEQAAKKVLLPMQKQPLPPEGYKITRYPLEKKAGQSNEDDGQSERDHTDVVNELRHQLRKARMEIGQHMRQVEDWKTTAKHTFEAARKIRAQMELERSRADRAESRISQLSAHFRSKAVVKARARSLGAARAGAPGNLSPSIHSPLTEEEKGTKKRASETPAILTHKRRRTVSELDEVTKSLASWLMSSKTSDEEGKYRSSAPSSSKTASENVFGATKQKDNLVYTPQINSGVRLALRAKVCSARGDTFSTAYDLMKQTKLLLADLPIIPESDQISIVAPKMPEIRITRRNRWSSVDSVRATTANSVATSSVNVSAARMSHSLSESALQDKASPSQCKQVS